MAREFSKFPHEVLEQMPGDWYDTLLAMDIAEVAMKDLRAKRDKILQDARAGKR